MTFKFDVRELQDFARRMGLAEEQIDDAIRGGLTEAAKQGVDIARRILRANGSYVSGDLWRSIKAGSASGRGGSLSVEYGPDGPYPGTWVERGRPPVHARAGGKLKFQIKGSGPYLYRNSVRAAPARPFMAPSATQVKPIARKLIREKVLAAVRRMV